MRVLILGSGQVANSLLDVFDDVVLFSRQSVDIFDAISLRSKIMNSACDIVINCIAATNVNKCEIDIKYATSINVEYTNRLSMLCYELHKKLIHISSDYIFDGNKLVNMDNDVLPALNSPLNVYGNTKLIGDILIESSLANHMICRTSWVVSKTSCNFVKTLVKKYFEGERNFEVVNDQYGRLTTSRMVADSIYHMCHNFTNGVTVNACGDKLCTWYDVAIDIFKILESYGYGGVTVTPKNSINDTVKRPAYVNMINSLQDIDYSYEKNLEEIVSNLINIYNK